MEGVRSICIRFGFMFGRRGRYIHGILVDERNGKGEKIIVYREKAWYV